MSSELNCAALSCLSDADPRVRSRGLDPDCTSPPPTRLAVEPGVMGMGMRTCAHINPSVQVRHRCRCTNKTVCGEEEEVAVLMAQQGRVPSNYLLPPPP